MRRFDRTLKSIGIRISCALILAAYAAYRAAGRTYLAARLGIEAYCSVPFLKAGCRTPLLRIRRVHRVLHRVRRWGPFDHVAAS